MRSRQQFTDSETFLLVRRALNFTLESFIGTEDMFDRLAKVAVLFSRRVNIGRVEMILFCNLLYWIMGQLVST